MYYHSLDIDDNDNDETVTIKKKKKKNDDGGGGGEEEGRTAIIDDDNSNSKSKSKSDADLNNSTNDNNCYYKYSGTSRLCLPCNRSRIDENFIINLCSAADQIITQLQMAAIVALKEEEQQQQQQQHQQQQKNNNDNKKFLENIRLRIIHQKGENHNDNNNDNDCDTIIIENKKEDHVGQKRKTKKGSRKRIYNSCLVNWYKPDHTIGLHSDDEPEMDTVTYPIVSLSLGGPRRFVLKSKQSQSLSKQHQQQQQSQSNNRTIQKNHEFILKDGDLFIMGGNCQKEYKHEIPKVRKTKDHQFGGITSNRISWTLRRMKIKTSKMKATTNNSTNSNSKSNSNSNNNNNNNNNDPKQQAARSLIRNPYASQQQQQQHKRQRR
ncbi:hypothetical protein FRACYDRAFT_233376 [Fragilariopsis cylindrus CCMP1102]|uniref:Fe2OG dioxygenase domain-containing protein n=1 Tax=Fragilariopsis cylindrus CCMP1102 TaxID=635003 RepID=A0A1E7FYI3_9STRA|nr:hypothetical protein FRACYDRAFT_233376 [Fragilariopsis cylindrus CCMP1102]|eukprot:OEU23207.1 hypothetical protein FRACYDRAFT_233376 [Fragilariopsis cylindrus CCMP1102]